MSVEQSEGGRRAAGAEPGAELGAGGILAVAEASSIPLTLLLVVACGAPRALEPERAEQIAPSRAASASEVTEGVEEEPQEEPLARLEAIFEPAPAPSPTAEVPVGAPAGPCWCFHWVHLADHGSTCRRTLAACRRERQAAGRDSMQCERDDTCPNVAHIDGRWYRAPIPE